MKTHGLPFEQLPIGLVVINYQRKTPSIWLLQNWQSSFQGHKVVSEKSLGTHFSIDDVLGNKTNKIQSLEHDLLLSEHLIGENKV